MAKKIYLVFNVVGNHEYTITKKNSAKGEVTTLFRSLSSDWTEAVRGEKVLKMIDSGNGVTFDREMQSLDYSELAELQILLRFNQKVDKAYSDETWRIIESKHFFEI
jgi:hypothetical protein